MERKAVKFCPFLCDICYRIAICLFHVMLSVNFNASKQTRFLCENIKYGKQTLTQIIIMTMLKLIFFFAFTELIT